jgi:hypothetical protein
VYDGNAGEALLAAKGSRARSLGLLKSLRASNSSFASNVGGSRLAAAGGGGHEWSSAVGTDGGGGGRLRGVDGGGAERRGADGAALRGDEGGRLRGEDGGGALRGADGGGGALRGIGIGIGGGALLEGGGGGTLRPVICGVGGGGGMRLRAAAVVDGGGGGGLLGRDSDAEREARLGAASAARFGGATGALEARLGGGGGAFEPGPPRAMTPDSDGRLESRLLSESKISSPEPLPLPLMEENHETSAAFARVPLAWIGERGLGGQRLPRACLRTREEASNGARRQSVSTTARTALRAIA